MSLFNKYLTIIQESNKREKEYIPRSNRDLSEKKGILTAPMLSFYDLERQKNREEILKSKIHKPYEFKDEPNLSDYEIQQRIQSNLDKQKEKEIQPYVDPEAEFKAKKAKMIHNDIDLAVKLKNDITIDMEQVYNDPDLSFTYMQHVYQYEKTIDKDIKEKLEASILSNTTYSLKYTVLSENGWLKKDKFNELISDILEDIKNNFEKKEFSKVLKSKYELKDSEIKYFKKKYPIYFK
jgi:hypothetical protein